MAKEKSGTKEKAETEKSPRSTQKTALDLPLKYLVISGKDEMKISRSVDGKVEDLSMLGLVLQTSSMRIDDLHLSYDESPLVRNKLTLEIDLPAGKKVTAIGEVSWYERSFASTDRVYHVGLTFKELNTEDRQALKEYLLAKKKTVEAIALDV